MSSRDEPDSLPADLLRRWKEELFSPDTVVAAVAVLVALPAGLLAGALVNPGAVYPVWFASAVGPSFGYWRGLRIEVAYGTAAKVGVVMALAIAVVTTGVVAAGTALGLPDDTAILGAGAVGLLFGAFVSRVAFNRFADR